LLPIKTANAKLGISFDLSSFFTNIIELLHIASFPYAVFIHCQIRPVLPHDRVGVEHFAADYLNA